MAESVSKRPRDEQESHIENIQQEDSSKRHKSLNDIVSLLEDEQEEEEEEELLITDSSHDFSCLLSTLQEELSSPSSSPNQEINYTKDVDDCENVIRHLLEASDDELGIPTSEISVDFRDVDDKFSLCEGLLWEFEDEAANYYTLLQSELFM